MAPICWSYQPVVTSAGTSIRECFASNPKWSEAWSRSHLRQWGPMPDMASSGMSMSGRCQSHLTRSRSVQSFSASAMARGPQRASLAHPLIGRQGDDAPPEHPAEAQHGAHLAVEQVGRDGLRDHRPQVRRAGVGQLQLCPAVVGASDRADAAVRPRQRGCPLDGVVAVLGVHVVGAVEAGLEVAAGGVPAAHVLHDVDVAALGHLPAALDEAGLVVGRPLDDDGEPSRRVGPVDVGAQHRAVACVTPRRHAP